MIGLVFRSQVTAALAFQEFGGAGEAALGSTHAIASQIADTPTLGDLTIRRGLFISKPAIHLYISLMRADAEALAQL